MFDNDRDVEHIAEAVARRIVDPLSERLVRIETLLEAHTRNATKRKDLFWKIVALGMSGPACLYTIVQIVS